MPGTGVGWPKLSLAGGVVSKFRKTSILRKLLDDQPLPGLELRDAAKDLKEAAEWLEGSADLGEESIPNAMQAVRDVYLTVDRAWRNYLTGAIIHASETRELRRYIKEIKDYEATI